jgi:hypothetical protein
MQGKTKTAAFPEPGQLNSKSRPLAVIQKAARTSEKAARRWFSRAERLQITRKAAAITRQAVPGGARQKSKLLSRKLLKGKANSVPESITETLGRNKKQ